MPFLFRGLKKLERWKQDTEAFSWVTPDDFAADPLIDLMPDHGGRLSVWYIENESSLERVLAAKIAERSDAKTAANVYPYLLVSLAVIVEEGFELDPTPGNTRDQEVNSWHRDIAKLSTNKLFRLARVIWEEKKLDEVEDWKTMPLVKKSIPLGYIDENRLNKGLRDALSRSG